MKVESSAVTETTPQQPPHPIFEELQPLVKGMCRHPGDMKLIVDEGGMCIIPHVADFRVVCGKRGRTIRSLKLLAQTAAARDGARVLVELEEGSRGQWEADWPFEQNVEFDVSEALARVRRIWLLVTGQELAAGSVGAHRDNDRLEVEVPIATADEEYLLMALNDVFYSWGFRNGMVIKIKPLKRK